MCRGCHDGHRFVGVLKNSKSRTRNRSLSNIGRARCAAINSDFLKIIISKYINYTIGINDNNCVFVCNLILGW